MYNRTYQVSNRLRTICEETRRTAHLKVIMHLLDFPLHLLDLLLQLFILLHHVLAQLLDLVESLLELARPSHVPGIAPAVFGTGFAAPSDDRGGVIALIAFGQSQAFAEVRQRGGLGDALMVPSFTPTSQLRLAAVNSL